MTARQKIRLCTALMLVVWLIAGFGWVWFARDLNFRVGDWPLNFWIAAQGSILVFLLVTVVNAWCINRWEKQSEADDRDAITSIEKPVPND